MSVTNDPYDTTAGIADDVPTIVARWRAWSDAVRPDLPIARDLQYGPSADETLDLVVPHAGAPLVIYFHGGWWKRVHKDDVTYVARGLTAHGVAAAIVNYGLAPDVPLEEITAQARRAVAWLRGNGDGFGVDVSRIVVAGHSAGGHLAAMCAAEAPVRGLATISGLHDLRPLIDSFVNEWLGLDAERAAALSPALATPYGSPELLAVWGERENPVFARQARALVAGWGTGTAEAYPGDHFTIVERLRDPDDPLTKRIAALAT